MIAISGPSKSGKTTLVEKLIASFKADGLKVGAIKHDPHGHGELDRPGKDSWRFREAGASVVQVAGPGTNATVTNALDRLTVASRGEPGDRPQASGELLDCDIVLVEGYREGTMRRIEVVPDGASPVLAPGTVAIAAAGAVLAPLPVFDRDDVAAIREFVWSFLLGLATPVAILAGGRSRRMGTDKALVRLSTGETLLEHAISTAREAAFDVSVVSRWPDRHKEVTRLAGARFFEDLGDNVHPATGIVTALAAHPASDGVLVIPCDSPGLGAAVLRRLDAAAELSGGQFAAFAIAGRVHPLPGFYGHGSAAALEVIAAEGRPVYELAGAVESVILSERAALAVDHGLASFRSLNTAEDVAAFRSTS